MRWPRSFALRTALAAAAAMLAVSVLGSAWSWLNAERALRQQLDIILAAEADGLLRDYEASGLTALAGAVDTYSRRRGPLLVLLQAPDGRTVAGRVPDVPARLQGFATLPGADGGARRALGAVLPGGFGLVVAADLAPARQAATALAWTSPLAALAAAAVALVGGFLAARGLERRLAGVSDAARAVVDGDLARRLPESSRGDEFDRLVGTINAMLARIAALVAAQRQVTDDIAHDLRGPLSRLRQRLEAALAGARDPAADAAALEAAVAELDGVLAAFSGLLRIARAESGADRAAFRDVDLSALAAEMAELYAPAAEDAGRRLTARIAPGLHLPGDPALLRQMVANLLDNALAYGGPSITLALGPGPVLDVADDGPGIPPEERERVVRRFYRLDRSRSTPGTGLGLALVAAAAGLHGGGLRLDAATPDGRGLLARVDLRGAEHDGGLMRAPESLQAPSA